jgi:lipopolysaccharide transport system permease protein
MEHTIDLPVRRIQPRKGMLSLDLREIWRFRELLVFIMWRDIKARYRQTILGSFWAIFRPFVSMVVFTVVFNHLAGIKPSGNIPYALFVFPGIVIWTYFSSALTGGSSSVTGNAPLITKAYFPRVHLVLSAIIAPLLDMALSLVIMFGLFAFYDRAPSWHVVLLPVFVALCGLTAVGLSLWLSTLTVRYRDVPFALPFLLQIWMYVTPVIYPTSFVPPRFQWLIAVNPISAVAVGVRWSLVGGPSPSIALLAASLAIGLGLTLTGLVYFRRREASFPDYV